MCEGIADELEGIDLGDKRLNRRGKRVIAALAANPEASINSSCVGWAETLAAYRLFDNPAVTPEEILRPHFAATQRRMREQPVVLIVQDTTELDYSDHPPAGMRCLERADRFGTYQHVHLAVRPDHLCLGLVGLKSYDRAAESLGRTLERKALPIEQKESFRWLEGYRLACRLAAECPQTQIVSVSDSEADIYDIFVEAQQLPGPRADYIIRAKEDRSLPELDPDGGPKTYRKVRDEVSRSKLLSARTIDLRQTPKRAARQAHLEIRALRVQVKPPQARSHLPTVTYNVVLVEEVGGPGDGTDVSWLLITTLPIGTLEQITQIIDYYLARWVAEIYFRTLKTGCRVEAIQLETIQRLANCLAFYHIIAWRVVHLTYLNRAAPKLPCTAVFDEHEWKPAWCVVTKKPLPPKPPTLAQFMSLLAELGGYNNRAKEPAPGPQPIWTGLRRMTDLAIAWLTFGPQSQQPCV